MTNSLSTPNVVTVTNAPGSVTWTYDQAEYDSAGGYYYFQLNGLEPNRYYHFNIKLSDGTTDSSRFIQASSNAAMTDYVRFPNVRNVDGNTTWWVKVQPWNFATYTLNWTTEDPPPPGPYSWDTAQAVGGATGSVQSTNVAADLDTRWYTFTPTTSETISLWTDQPYGYIEIYSGSTENTSSWIDDGWSDSTGAVVEDYADFTPTPGVTYHIAYYINDPGGDPLGTTYTMYWKTAAPPPYVVDNNDFTAPEPIDLASTGPITYDNTGASHVPSPPDYNDEPRSIWYSLSPVTEDTFVKFTGVPGFVDPATNPHFQILVLRDEDPANVWWSSIGSGTYNDRFGSIIAKLSPGKQYRLSIAFPNGDAGVWDDNGTLSWQLSKAAPNGTSSNVLPLDQAATITSTSLGGFEDQFFEIVAPIDGGLSILQGYADQPASVNTSVVVYERQTDGSLAYRGAVGNRSTSQPTAPSYVQSVKAGDVVIVNVQFAHGNSGSTKLRWGISTQVTWGPWQDASEQRADSGYPPYRPWYINGGISQRWAKWSSAVDDTVYGNEGTTARYFDGQRARADAGENAAITPPDSMQKSNVGYDGWFASGYAGLQGNYTRNQVNLTFFASEWKVLPPPDEVANGGTLDPWEVQHWPILNQSTYNGLNVNGYNTDVPSELRKRAVEWRDGAGAIEHVVYVGPQCSWNRDVGNTWAGNVHTIATDPFKLQIRRSSLDLETLASTWRNPADVAGMPVEWEYVADPNTRSGSYTSQHTDADFIIYRDVKPGDTFVWAHTTDMHAKTLPVDGAKILDDHRVANNGGNQSTLPFWNLNGDVSWKWGQQARIYPDYRLGTYTESFAPIDTSPTPSPDPGTNVKLDPSLFPQRSDPVDYVDYSTQTADTSDPYAPISSPTEEPYKDNSTSSLYIPLPTPPKYTYATYDLHTNSILAEVPFENVSYSHKLSKAGTASMSMPVNPTTLKMGIKNSTVPGKTGVYIFRDDEIMWGGILWKRMYESQSRSVRFECETFESYFYHRFQSMVLGWEDVDQLTMARSYALQAAGDIGIDVDETLSGVNRYHNSFNYEFKTLGSEIDELAGLFNGFDWNVRVYIDEMGILRRRLVWGYPQLGVSAANTTMLFEYPGAIRGYTTTEDAARSGNRVFAIGGGQGLDQIYYEARDQQMLDNGWPLLEISTAYKDVFIPSELAARALQDLHRLRTPVALISANVSGSADPKLGSYFPGDYARFAIEDHWNDQILNATMRITGFTVNNVGKGSFEDVTLDVEAGGGE